MSGISGTPYLFDADGQQVTPGKGDFAVPHVYTFGSILSGGWKTYLHEKHDEALRHHRENALAMRREPFLMALLRERKDSTLRLKWHLESDNPKDPTEKAACDAMAKAVRSIRRIKRIQRQLLEALWYGRYGVQIKWGWRILNLPTPVYSGPAESGMAPGVELRPTRVFTVVDHRPLNGDKIGYTHQGTPWVLAGAGMSSEWAGKAGVKMVHTSVAPAVLLEGNLRKKIIIHTHDPDDADYWEAEAAGAVFGVGIRSRIYWSYWLSQEYFSWVTETFERIGLGLVVIKYDMSSADAKVQAEKTAKNYSRRSAILIPVASDSMRSGSQVGVEVVEAPIAGAGIVLQLQQALEAKMSRYIIGQTLSGDSEGSGLGGTGVAALHADTKADIIAADAEDLAETLTGDPAEPGLVDTMFRWTMPQLFGKFPMRWVYNLDETAPAEKLAAVQAAAGLGVVFDMDEVRALTGLSRPEEGAEVVGGMPQPAPGGPGAPPGLPPGQEEDDTSDLGIEPGDEDEDAPPLDSLSGRLSGLPNGVNGR